jgi:hypothetical protein
MAKVDDILKKLAVRHIGDYLRWLLPAPVTVVRKLDSELPAARRADLVYLLVTDSGERFVFHLEFQQARSEAPMNLRMLGYDVRLREEHRLPVCGEVIYLKPAADEGFNGQFIGRCPIRENQGILTYFYGETKLWELNGKALLERQGVGIYPLLSLTQLGEPIQETLRQMVSEIKKIPDTLLRQDTLFAFKMVGSILHPMDFLEAIIRREDYMESPLIQEIYEEGKLDDKREVLLMQLKVKFGDVPRSVNTRIQRLRSDKTLNGLLQKVVTASSLGELGFK